MQANRLCKHCYQTLYTLLLLLFAHGVCAQTIENLSLEQAGDKIIIHFDFSSDNSDNYYQLKVYHSINNYSKPISLVRGDVGDRIKPGSDKSIEWYAREEVGAFMGELVIEIRIFQTPESIYILSPAAKSKIKRGSALDINWSGGINEEEVTIHLMQNGQLAETIANNIDNNGSYTWISPSKIKPGKNYSIQIAGSSKNETQSTSNPFTIARKVPLWLIIAPAAVIGAVVAIILLDEPDPEETDLPAAPDPN